MRTLGTSDMEISEFCLGTNVFGGTIDQAESFAVLDAYLDSGGNFIDTADLYSSGTSEQIIGNWLADRGHRGDVVLATKCGYGGEITAANVKAWADDSLRRLQTDHIDLFYVHKDDPETPLEETLVAFDELVTQGKVRQIGASNFTAARLTEALETQDRLGLARFVALQPLYNLVERDDFEGDLAEVCIREGLSCVPYFSLALGFLTGKYRPGVEIESHRAPKASSYLDGRGLAVLAALDEISATHMTAVAAVSLAWLLAQPGVDAPIASARNPKQLADLTPFPDLKLSEAELAQLTEASA